MYLGTIEVDDWYVVLIGLEPRIVARRSNIDFLIFKRGLRVAHSSRNNTDVIETHVPCRPTQNSPTHGTAIYTSKSDENAHAPRRA